ncbi:hypothetical protein EMCRGX_G024260 [Ephydatia muelleri]
MKAKLLVCVSAAFLIANLQQGYGREQRRKDFSELKNEKHHFKDGDGKQVRGSDEGAERTAFGYLQQSLIPEATNDSQLQPLLQPFLRAFGDSEDNQHFNDTVVFDKNTCECIRCKIIIVLCSKLATTSATSMARSSYMACTYAYSVTCICIITVGGSQDIVKYQRVTP